jgi:hypothetical protein
MVLRRLCGLRCQRRRPRLVSARCSVAQHRGASVECLSAAAGDRPARGVGGDGAAGADVWVSVAPFDFDRHLRQRHCRGSIRRRLGTAVARWTTWGGQEVPLFQRLMTITPFEYFVVHHSKFGCSTSATGHSRHFERGQATSAHHPLVDISVHRSAARRPTRLARDEAHRMAANGRPRAAPAVTLDAFIRSPPAARSWGTPPNGKTASIWRGGCRCARPPSAPRRHRSSGRAMRNVAAPCFKWRCRIVFRLDQFSADAQHRCPGDDGDAFGRASIVAVNFGADSREIAGNLLIRHGLGRRRKQPTGRADQIDKVRRCLGGSWLGSGSRQAPPVGQFRKLPFALKGRFCAGWTS